MTRFDGWDTQFTVVAGSLLCPDVVTAIAMYAVAFAAGLCLAQPQLQPDGPASTAIANVIASNLQRCASRSAAKVLGLVAITVALVVRQNEDQLSGADHVPPISDVMLYSVFYGAMGLIDELHDNPAFAGAGTSRWMAASYLALCVPIVYLIPRDPMWRDWAVFTALTHVVTKKADLMIFKVAVALMVVTAVGAAMLMPAASSSTPWLGVLALAAGQALYEVHDEPGVVQRYSAMAGLPTWVWQAFNSHFLVIALASLRVLPLSWMVCSSLAYPVAKLGLMHGSLARGAACGKEPVIIPAPAPAPTPANI